MKTLYAVPLALGLLAASAFVPRDDKWPKIVTEKTLYAKTDLRGKKAPDLFVESWLTGGAPNTKGKVLLVDYWATWCGPCRKLIPEMNAWAQKFKNEVVFIGISDESAKTVSDFMKKTPMNYNVGVDASKKMSNVLGVQGIPHVMIVSSDGIVRWQGFPGSEEDPLTERVIEQIVKANKQ